MRREVFVMAAGFVALALAAGELALRWVRPPPRPSLPPPAAKVNPGRTNVVLVVGCTVRADQTTPYGGPAGTTPFVADMAAGGALFTNTFANAPWTQPAFTSITTGRYASSVGMVNTGGGPDGRRLSGGVTTLSERFRAAGYSTFGGAMNPNGNDGYGFGQGFDDYWSPVDRWRRHVVKSTTSAAT